MRDGFGSEEYPLEAEMTWRVTPASRAMFCVEISSFSDLSIKYALATESLRTRGKKIKSVIAACIPACERRRWNQYPFLHCPAHDQGSPNPSNDVRRRTSVQTSDLLSFLLVIPSTDRMNNGMPKMNRAETLICACRMEDQHVAAYYYLHILKVTLLSSWKVLSRTTTSESPPASLRFAMNWSSRRQREHRRQIRGIKTNVREHPEDSEEEKVAEEDEAGSDQGQDRCSGGGVSPRTNASSTRWEWRRTFTLE